MGFIHYSPILIEETSHNLAWRSSMKTLIRETPTTSGIHAFDRPVLIAIQNPRLEDPDPLFPVAAEDLKLICEYMINGSAENRVVHEWTKIYYHRIHDTPFSQINYLIELLRNQPDSGRAVISLWDKSIDQNAELVPCTLVLWAKVRGEHLDLHVHARASDAYKKLLMNLMQFIAIHEHIAHSLSLNLGTYVHFLDSCHVYKQDLLDARACVDSFQ